MDDGVPDVGFRITMEMGFRSHCGSARSGRAKKPAANPAVDLLPPKAPAFCNRGNPRGTSYEHGPGRERGVLIGV